MTASPPSPSAELARCAARATGAFLRRFGQEPASLGVAPGRVNLIGEHTDYNGGFVLPVAIDRYTVAAAGPAGRRDGSVRIASASAEGEARVHPDRPVVDLEPAWARYAAGVLWLAWAAGRRTAALDLWIESTLPVGSGLSSSAALEVAVATVLESLAGAPFEPLAKVELCRRAEHEFAGVPCGIMDQAAVVLSRPGHALWIDCRESSFRHIPIRDEQMRLLVVDTRTRHALAGGRYAERHAECREAARLLGVASLREATPERLERAGAALGPRLGGRVRHVLAENDRVARMAAALERGAWAEAGRLMYAGHDSLRDDFEVSCAELDAVVEAARAIGPEGGVFGCRMTGAGFGGCAVALVAADRVDSVASGLAEACREAIAGGPSFLATGAMGGARVLPVPAGPIQGEGA